MRKEFRESGRMLEHTLLWLVMTVAVFSAGVAYDTMYDEAWATYAGLGLGALSLGGALRAFWLMLKFFGIGLSEREGIEIPWRKPPPVERDGYFT